MLADITIQNFAIVKSLELEFSKGMTAITGETGAGKSISIDALGLCLGDRADANMVRPGEKRAEISTSFTLEQNSAARRWLQDNELEDGDDCIFKTCDHQRRTVTGLYQWQPSACFTAKSTRTTVDQYSRSTRAPTTVTP